MQVIEAEKYFPESILKSLQSNQNENSIYQNLCIKIKVAIYCYKTHSLKLYKYQIKKLNDGTSGLKKRRKKQN